MRPPTWDEATTLHRHRGGSAASPRGVRRVATWSIAASLPGALAATCAAVLAAAGDGEPTRAEETAFRAAVGRVAAAVVRLEPIGGSAAELGAGAEAVPGAGPTSGLVIDPAGWIVTTAFGVPVDMQRVVVVRPDG
ncbi:MAG: hypothetical protein EBS51_12560, partial [Planctomycetia bacterium]|nr:hypothetical protein [Planctomycetia bacterium]